MQVLKISIYLGALVAANLTVLHFGKWGLAFTAFFLIPFDFVMRSALHETWQGKMLWIRLGLLIFVSSLITYAINSNAVTIAKASASAFVLAQVTAGIVYQLLKRHEYLTKVNASDFVAISVDSLIFQWIAFGGWDTHVTASQIVLKTLGGFMWYYIIFVKCRIQDKW